MTPFESLIHEHHALVYRVALGVLRDPAAAEDVAQDVFVHMLENPDALERARSARAVLAAAARNRALNALRGERRRDAREEAAMQAVRKSPDPAELAFRSELRAKVAALPEDQRAAVDLHYFQGLTLPECALALELPEGTVSSRISAALSKLRAALAGAATAALLAMLESELSACGTEELPAGLEGRIARAAGARRPRRRAPGGSAKGGGEGVSAPASRWRRAPVALGAAALLLLIGGWLAWKLRAGGGEGGGEDASTRPNSGTAGGATASTPPDSATADPPVTTAKLGPVRLVDGFLLRAHGGLTLGEPDATKLGGAVRVYSGATGDFPELGSAGKWRFVDDLRLRELPAADSMEVRDVSPGSGEASPWTRLRAKARLRQSDADVREAEIVEVLEVESLSLAWWRAWRELHTVRGVIDVVWDDTPPGPERRAKLMTLAEAAARALTEARAARAGQKAPRRAAMMENDLAGSVSARLRAVGLGDLFPPSPDAWDLHEALMISETAELLRWRLVQSWGEDATWLEAWAVRSWGDGAMQGAVDLAEACAMEEEAYARLRADLLKHAGNRRRRTADPVELAERRARYVAVGLEIRPIGPLERETLLLDGGVLVVAVAPGGLAEKAGLRAGDVVWRARGAGDASPAAAMDEDEAAALAERWLNGRAEGTRLQVVRGDRVETITLAK
jgi:RNA polymerase sigma-70 factor (ECF subfamily)